MIKLKHLGLAVASGILLSLPWITGFSYFIFIAFVPLLYLNDTFFKFKRAGAFNFWLLSFISFFIWNIIVSGFISKVSFFSALALWTINSFLMSFVWYLSFLYDSYSKKKSNYWFLIIAWISLEFLQYNWDFEWPWFTLGNALATAGKLIQWYRFTGVFGGSLWVFLVNISIFSIIKLIVVKDRILIPTVLSLLFLIVIPISISLYLNTVKTQLTKQLKVLIVQPDIDPYTEKFDGLSVADQYDRFMNLVFEFQDSTIDLIVGPETFLHDVDETELKTNSQFVIDTLRSIFPGSTIILGGSTFIADSSDSKTHFNSAIVSNEKQISIYHKEKLVSGVEKMPFQKLLNYFGDLIFINLGGINHYLSNKTSETLFINKEYSFVTPICYEAIFGDYCRKLINSGGEFFITITNDGWWKGTSGYRQHLQLSKIRCIENGKYMVRAANNGISAIINNRGEVIEKSKFGVQDTIYNKIEINDLNTFYTKHGDYLARMSVFLFVLLMGKWMVERKIKPH